MALGLHNGGRAKKEQAEGAELWQNLQKEQRAKRDVAEALEIGDVVTVLRSGRVGTLVEDDHSAEPYSVIFGDALLPQQQWFKKDALVLKRRSQNEDAAGSAAPVSFYYSDSHEAEEAAPRGEAPQAAEPEEEKTNYFCVALKTILGIAAFVGISTLLQAVAGDKITEVSIILVEKVGLTGVFLAVFIADGLPQPFTYLPIVYMMVEGAVPRWLVITVVSGASWVACMWGYGIGRCFRRPGSCRDRFDRMMEKYPSVPDLMQRRGNMGVVAAGILPVPLPIVTYAAGFFGVNFGWFMLAALSRAPKIAVIVALCPSPEPEPERGLFF